MTPKHPVFEVPNSVNNPKLILKNLSKSSEDKEFAKEKPIFLTYRTMKIGLQTDS